MIILTYLFIGLIVFQAMYVINVHEFGDFVDDCVYDGYSKEIYVLGILLWPVLIYFSIKWYFDDLGDDQHDIQD